MWSFTVWLIRKREKKRPPLFFYPKHQRASAMRLDSKRQQLANSMPRCGWWVRPRSLHWKKKKNYFGWFVVREKYYSAWKNKLKKIDYKRSEQDLTHWITAVISICAKTHVLYNNMNLHSLRTKISITFAFRETILIKYILKVLIFMVHN